MKKSVWVLVLVAFLAVSVLPGSAFADSSSSDAAVQGGLIGAAVGTVVAVIMAIAAADTRAKDPEARERGRGSAPAPSALNVAPLEGSFNSPAQNPRDLYAIVIRF